MKEKITIFSTPNCPYCIQLKAYLKSKDISFEDIDVSERIEAAEKMFTKSHHMGVPQVWIKEEVIVGFDVERINQLLDIK